MRIAKIEPIICDAGWRPWVFVKVETDDGLVGWGECSDGRMPRGVAGSVRDFEDALIGQDPRQVERLYWTMSGWRGSTWAASRTRQWPASSWRSGTSRRKALGVSVCELFGGPMRERMRVYWSHCGTSRARNWRACWARRRCAPTTTSRRSARRWCERGFTALKTNIVIPGDPARVYSPGFDMAAQRHRRGRSRRRSIEPDRAAARHVPRGGRAGGRDRAGPELQLQDRWCVADRARLLEKFNMQWVEYDNWDPVALRQIKDSTSTPIASCESLITRKQYRPFLELHATDVCIIDLPWNGWGQAQARRRHGRGVRDQHRAAQLLQPPVVVHLGPVLCHRPELQDHGDRHRRRGLEGPVW